MCCDTAWQITDSRGKPRIDFASRDVASCTELAGGWMTRKANLKLDASSAVSEATCSPAGQEPGQSLQATSGDLLSDVYYLAQQMACETDARLRGLYARSA